MYKLKCQESGCNAEIHSHKAEREEAIQDLKSQLLEHYASPQGNPHPELSEEKVQEIVSSKIEEEKLSQ